MDVNLRGFERVFGLQSVEDSIADGGAGAAMSFWLYLRNSIIVATLVTAGQVFFCAMAAYSFSRLRWRGRDAVFGVFLGSLMVPSIFTLLPNFVLVKQLGLVDNLMGVALPTMLMTPFAVFFLRQFFLSLPREIEEAAMLDGLGPIARFFRVTIPMSTGPIMTMALITIIGMWKDFLWPLLVGRNGAQLLTVALGIFQQQSPNRAPDWTGLMAGSTLSVTPVLILLVLMGRKLVESLNFSGIK